MQEDNVTADRSVVAFVAGKPYTELPTDLFIPPDALEVLLETFTGPLDLLLYLIRKQNIDILDIPIALITKQYIQYIQLMEETRLELAADYLVMAALLAEIKSKMLLPVINTDEEETEEDPRLVLVRKLQLYEQFKQAAENLDTLPRCNRDIFRFAMPVDGAEIWKTYPDVQLSALIEVMQDLMANQRLRISHHIKRELLSVRERMSNVLTKLQIERDLCFQHLFTAKEGRMGLVVSLLAILELARQALLTIIQANNFSPIYLQAIE